MDNVKGDFYYSKRILSNIDACLAYLNGFDINCVERNGMLCDALENRFTKLSEDCSKLSAEYKKKLSDVNWTAISAMRNRIGHAYDTVDIGIIYRTVKLDFLSFKNSIIKNSDVFYLDIAQDSLNSVLCGATTVLLRLFDEGNRRLKLGQIIVCKEKGSNKELVCEIKTLETFGSFEEAYAHYRKEELGYGPEEKASPDDMFRQYAKEEVKAANGVLAVGLRLI